MKIQILLALTGIGAYLGAICQPTLTFTAENNGQYVAMDSILIQNLTQGGDTTLYLPDSLLVLDNLTSITEMDHSANTGLAVYPNYPNPMMGKTTIDIYLPEPNELLITLNDVIGRELIRRVFSLGPGHHTFRLYAGINSLYLFNAATAQQSRTIRILNSSSGALNDESIRLEYIGEGKKGIKDPTPLYTMKDIGFDPGDELQCTSFADMGNVTILISPDEDQTVTFQYAAAGLPCPLTPTLVDIDGNVYNTVLIGSQCWMKENLKTTTFSNEVLIPNVTDQETWFNLATAAYVWNDNDITWSEPYGALYNGYTITDPDNDVCPLDWHVPSDEEWAILINYIGGPEEPFGNEYKSCRQVDSPLGGDCNTTEHPRWNADVVGNPDLVDYGTDDYGFAGLPSGRRGFGNPEFDALGIAGYWWTSTEADNNDTVLEVRSLNNESGLVGGSFFSKDYGFSVRCVKD